MTARSVVQRGTTCELWGVCHETSGCSCCTRAVRRRPAGHRCRAGCTTGRCGRRDEADLRRWHRSRKESEKEKRESEIEDEEDSDPDEARLCADLIRAEGLPTFCRVLLNTNEFLFLP